MLGVAEASSTTLAHVRRLESERVALAECAGRVLAANIIARVSMPPWDNSSMDGYAVRSDDVRDATETNPVDLEIVGDIPAGAFAERSIASGEAMRIMTGAPIPSGADSVARLEDTDRGIKRVAIRTAVAAGRNVRYTGEDFLLGAIALSEGTTLHAAHVGVLASLGADLVSVYRAPRVAIISSGDELVTVEGYAEVEAGRKIVSSNNYALAALVREAGGIPVDLGIAEDTLESLREKLENARDCDLILTSAGVSVGEKDFTREVIAQLGGEQIFWRVRMRPGAPLAFGNLFGKPWLGVSGNPVSAMVSFLLFARPVIRKMMGHTLLFPPLIEARSEEEIKTSAPLTHFLRGIISVQPDGGYSARLSGSQSSGVMTALANANALLIIREDVQHVPAGGTIHAIPIRPDNFMTGSLRL